MNTKTCTGCHVEYPLAEYRIVRVGKWLKDGSRSVWEGPISRCRACLRANNRTEHTRALVRERARRRRARDPQYRVKEQMRLAEKRGYVYRSRAEIKAQAYARAMERERQRLERQLAHPKATTKAQWIARLQQQLPELYDESLATDSLVWRARYNLDPAFKAREIARLHAKKNRDMHHNELLNDGSLTPDVIANLFAAARRCPYCTSAMQSGDKSLDHIWPRRSGGWHSITNVVVCCKRCNARKHGRTPDQWLGKLDDTIRLRVERLYRRITRGMQPWLVA